MMKLLSRKSQALASESEVMATESMESLAEVLARLEKSIADLTSATETLTFTVVASGVEGINPDTFARLGGVYGVRQAVTLLYERVMEDGELAPYFKGADMVRIRYRQADMFMAIMGIQTYTGVRLGVIHRHLNVPPATFARLLWHVSAVLRDVGLAEEEIESFLSTLRGFEPEIVQGGKR